MTNQQHEQCKDIKRFIIYLEALKENHIDKMSRAFYTNSQDFSDAGRQLNSLNESVIHTLQKHIKDSIKKYEELFAKI